MYNDSRSIFWRGRRNAFIDEHALRLALINGRPNGDAVSAT